MARFTPKPETTKRLWKARIAMTLIALLLLVRVFYIQVIKGDSYANRVGIQQTLRIPISLASGHITDRNGIPFTKAEETFRLLIFPEIVRKDEKTYTVVSRLTNKSLFELYQLESQGERYYLEDVKNKNYKLINDIEEGKYLGLILIRESKRYDDKSLARHIVGHIRMYDGIPVSGIEKEYEKYLHSGSPYMVNVFIDAANKYIPGLGHAVTNPDDPIYDVRLTLDFHIQEILEKAFDNDDIDYQGGVVLDIESREILALASRPHYNQYDPLSTDNADFLAVPLQQYEPGSVFKIVVAAAALEHGGFENRAYTCEGGISIGNNHISCSSRAFGMGPISLKDAFAYSCNDIFIKIAMELGGDEIIEAARRLGLDSSLNIGLYNGSGRLMTRDKYAGAGIANLAIGQGDTQITPLQAVSMIATICDRGLRRPVSLVKGIVNGNGQLIEESPGDIGYSSGIRAISEETAQKLMDYMNAVTLYGTGRYAYDESIGGCGGKTGTPEVVGDPISDEYSWFVGYFPKDDPKYAIAILCRQKGGGGSIAAPIFKEVSQEIYKYERSLKGVNKK